MPAASTERRVSRLGGDRWLAMNEDCSDRISARLAVGRELEQQAISHFLGSLTEGPRALVIAGDAGLGKTTLWEGALEEARHRSYVVLATRPRASESSLGL